MIIATTATIDVREPEPRAVDAATIALAGVGIDALGKALKPLVRLRPRFGGGVELVPGTRVGTIAVGGLRVNVRPRLGDADLVGLIRYAYGDNDYAAERSAVAADEGAGLDELIGRVLAEELSMIRRRGLARRYVERRERLPAVRGRVDFLASFPLNDRGNATLACRYHELSCDNADNRLIVAGLDAAAAGLATRERTRAALAAHRHAWRGLAAAPASAGPTDFAAARSRYTRLNDYYRLAHHLCELIVERCRPRSLYETASIATAGVALDLARLFELAVARLLRDALRPLGFDVKAQRVDRDAILDAAGGVYRHVRPDVLITRDGVPVAVVDAKYKDLWRAGADGRPERKIGNDDLYQLFFYASRQQLAHGLASPLPAVIVAPLDAAGPAIAARYRQVRLEAGAPHELTLALLPLTAIAREGGRGPASAAFADAVRTLL